MLDRWKLKEYAPGEGIALGVYIVQFDSDDWIDVAIPGDVHQALITAGRIPDGYSSQSEDRTPA